jgi:hypothetical protein
MHQSKSYVDEVDFKFIAYKFLSFKFLFVEMPKKAFFILIAN